MTADAQSIPFTDENKKYIYKKKIKPALMFFLHKFFSQRLMLFNFRLCKVTQRLM